MVVVKRKKRVDLTVIDNIVHAHLDYLKSTGEEFTCSEISETLRYALCVVQGLETRGYSERIERLGVGLVNVLRPVVAKAKIAEDNLDAKRGLLEACVLSIEASRNRVLGVVKP